MDNASAGANLDYPLTSTQIPFQSRVVFSAGAAMTVIFLT